MLSKSNTPRQQLLVLSDYLAIDELAHMAFIEQDRAAVVLWTRNPDGWRAEEVTGLDAALPLTAVGVDLPLAEIYEGLQLEA